MKYHERARDLEYQLALAQGLEVTYMASSGTVWVLGSDGQLTWRPRPAHDVADCINLMLEVGVWPREIRFAAGAAFEVVDVAGNVRCVETILHGDDKKVAMMLAVVAGAIDVLLERKDNAAVPAATSSAVSA